MEKPSLVILAAGIGSRYGGLKQIDPVGSNGELIIDYSVYDAYKAGFERVVFIITRAIRDEFISIIGKRIERYVRAEYVFQEMEDIPRGYAIPEGRVKPWGTTHALLAARSVVKGPFAVINADDFYGARAYKTIYDWLSAPLAPRNGKMRFAMVGYMIENTVSSYGSVARGICKADSDGYLTSIVERTMVEKSPEGARFSEDKGKIWTAIPKGTLVSMNFWGLTPDFFKIAEDDFPRFLDENLPQNPLKCEYLLPNEIGLQLRSGLADVEVLRSIDSWYGVTYSEDGPAVKKALAEMHQSGVYPTPLWK